jgi:hypothetical protein
VHAFVGANRNYPAKNKFSPAETLGTDENGEPHEDERTVRVFMDDGETRVDVPTSLAMFAQEYLEEQCSKRIDEWRLEGSVRGASGAADDDKMKSTKTADDEASKAPGPRINGKQLDETETNTNGSSGHGSGADMTRNNTNARVRANRTTTNSGTDNIDKKPSTTPEIPNILSPFLRPDDPIMPGSVMRCALHVLRTPPTLIEFCEERDDEDSNHTVFSVVQHGERTFEAGKKYSMKIVTRENFKDMVKKAKTAPEANNEDEEDVLQKMGAQYYYGEFRCKGVPEGRVPSSQLTSADKDQKSDSAHVLPSEHQDIRISLLTKDLSELKDASSYREFFWQELNGLVDCVSNGGRLVREEKVVLPN